MLLAEISWIQGLAAMLFAPLAKLSLQHWLLAARYAKVLLSSSEFLFIN